MTTACVTFCDEKYFKKAERTLYELRALGRWTGDIVLIAIDFDPPPMEHVIVYKTSHIPTDQLLEFYEKNPFSKGDGRHLRLVVQWDKLQVFRPFFQQWDRILLLDAGMRVLSDISPMWTLDWKGTFWAPDDGEYPTNDAVRFHTMLDETACPAIYEKLLQTYSSDILQRRQFVPCVFMFDTSLTKTISYEELVDAMNTYPIGMCNEMMTMNLLFNCKYDVWKPFPRMLGNRYTFGWNESPGNGTPGTWRDFVFMKYPFYTPETILADPHTAFVTLSDASYYPKARHSLHELQTNGQWGGDVVLIAVDFDPEPMPGVEIYRTTHVDTSNLFEQWKTHPIAGLPDNRHYGKVYQWDKLQVFKEHFKRWDRIVFLDAGLRVFNSVQPLLDLPWKGKFLAPDDSDPYDNGLRFRNQLDVVANPDVLSKLLATYSDAILNERYFLNCMFVFDTALLDKDSFAEMESMMNEYPICMCNEMGVMNLFMTFKRRVWQAFPKRVGDKYLFGWSERNYTESPTSKEFHFMKYSFTS